MKTKITNLADMAMSERTMNSFAGGATCGCACRFFFQLWIMALLTMRKA